MALHALVVYTCKTALMVTMCRGGGAGMQLAHRCNSPHPHRRHALLEPAGQMLTCSKTTTHVLQVSQITRDKQYMHVCVCVCVGAREFAKRNCEFRLEGGGRRENPHANLFIILTSPTLPITRPEISCVDDFFIS